VGKATDTSKGKERGDRLEGDREHGKGHARRDGHGSVRGEHFSDRHRSAVRDYYDSRYKSGRCPPGLAKKHNGCMPPGLAKKWRLGHPLPRDVVFYEIPHKLVVQIGVPPQGYRYVRVAGDILLIAIGTAMVVDAIEDLGRH
jgi:Ni/Co efflux regulator RcnB